MFENTFTIPIHLAMWHRRNTLWLSIQLALSRPYYGFINRFDIGYHYHFVMISRLWDALSVYDHEYVHTKNVICSGLMCSFRYVNAMLNMAHCCLYSTGDSSYFANDGIFSTYIQYTYWITVQISLFFFSWTFDERSVNIIMSLCRTSWLSASTLTKYYRQSLSRL